MQTNKLHANNLSGCDSYVHRFASGVGSILHASIICYSPPNMCGVTGSSTGHPKICGHRGAWLA